MQRVEDTRGRAIIKGTGPGQGELAPLKVKGPDHQLPYPVYISAESILPPLGNLQGVMDGLFWYQSWISLVMEVEPLLPPWGDTHSLALPVPREVATLMSLPASAHGSAWVGFNRQVHRNGPCPMHLDTISGLLVRNPVPCALMITEVRQLTVLEL